MLRCHVAVNNAIRRIYSYHYYDSVRHLRNSCGLKSIYDIFHRATSKFDEASVNSSNQIIRFIANCDLNWTSSSLWNVVYLMHYHFSCDEIKKHIKTMYFTDRQRKRWGWQREMRARQRKRSGKRRSLVERSGKRSFYFSIAVLHRWFCINCNRISWTFRIFLNF